MARGGSFRDPRADKDAYELGRQMTISENVYQILIAGGGAAIVCGGIIISLWKLSTAALLEKLKHSQTELERLKDELSRSALRASRYGGAQFGAYQEIWDTLCDLRLAADRLWDRATPRNVEEFGRHFQAVRRVVYGREVLIEEPHLATLRRLVDAFREFYDGKEGLLELRRQVPPNQEAIVRLIDRNGQVRKSFAATLEALSTNLRAHLRNDD